MKKNATRAVVSRLFARSPSVHAGKARYGVVVSRFNEAVTSKLLASCLDALQEAGVAPERIAALSIPGAFELPWTAQEMALSGRYDVIICLGCVLKGATSQNEHISRVVVAELQALAVRSRVPCVLGLITPDTWKQAVARTRGSLDRGREAAQAALELAELRFGGCLGRRR
ncbi:MAG: 6,7-dimethyl-8-ribityllumazine synthase [Elusimicrobiota bacterium]